jgi:hypothetical protein
MAAMNRVWMVRLGVGAIVVMAACLAIFALPSLLKISVQYEQKKAFSAMQEQFPVTVNLQDKTITENPQVEAFFGSPSSPLQAAVGNVADVFGVIFVWIATTIANSPWYDSLAATDGRVVNITPGMRKEQVVKTFADVLGWSAAQKKQFLTVSPYSSLPLSEGSFSPGIYFVTTDTTPLMAQALVNQRFSEEILAHYGTTTAALVPLNHALTIASLIEREAGGSDDMRFISGIIWNRLFINMNLQIDATLQYAKANTASAVSWWPKVLATDQFRKSLYNTYLHKGLPPTPIANPSVASVLAALNPKKTSCLFYFHDSSGGFHCTDTYAEHVALLKKYYGRGK